MTTAEKVELILKHDPASRNSDKRLTIVFMQKAGMNLSPEQIKMFYSLPSLETLRRTRQQLQMEDKYPANEAINEKRYAKYQKMKNHDYSNPEEVIDGKPARVYKLLEWGK